MQDANPYENALPVTHPKDLYGRQAIFAAVIRRLFKTATPQSQQVVGLPRSGKTSFLNALANVRSLGNEYLVCVDIDQSVLDQTVFIPVSCLSIADGDPNSLWRLLSRQLGRACPDESLSLSAGFEDLESQIARLVSRGLFLVFLLDDFDAVATSSHIEWSGQLRSLVESYQPALSYVTALRKDLSKYRLESQHPITASSPLLNILTEVHYLGQLSSGPGPRDIEAYVCDLSEQAGVTFSQTDAKCALELGGRHPEVTRMVCRLLYAAREQDPDALIDYAWIEQRVVEEYRTRVYQATMLALDRAEIRLLENLAAGLQPAGLRAGLSGLRLLGLVVGDDDDPKLFSDVLARCLAVDAGTAVKEIPQQELAAEIGESGNSVPSDANTRHDHTVRLWTDQHAVELNGKLISLPPTEWRLFQYLHNRAGTVCARQELIADLWPGQQDKDRALGVAISRLRKHIEEDPKDPKRVVTWHGVGYVFEP